MLIKTCFKKCIPYLLVELLFLNLVQIDQYGTKKNAIVLICFQMILNYCFIKRNSKTENDFAHFLLSKAFSCYFLCVIEHNIYVSKMSLRYILISSCNPIRHYLQRQKLLPGLRSKII